MDEFSGSPSGHRNRRSSRHDFGKGHSKTGDDAFAASDEHQILCTQVIASAVRYLNFTIDIWDIDQRQMRGENRFLRVNLIGPRFIWWFWFRVWTSSRHPLSSGCLTVHTATQSSAADIIRLNCHVCVCVCDIGVFIEMFKVGINYPTKSTGNGCYNVTHSKLHIVFHLQYTLNVSKRQKIKCFKCFDALLLQMSSVKY